MNIILSGDDMQRSYAISLRGWRFPAALLLAAVLLGWAVHRLAEARAERWVALDDPRILALVEAERAGDEAARLAIWRSTVDRLEQEIAALNVRLWQLGHLGNQLAKRTGMDEEALLDLAPEPPAPAADLGGAALDADERMGRLEAAASGLAAETAAEALRLGQVSEAVALSSMQWATVPMRRPIEGRYWFTSGYGTRNDPFTGKKAFHAGYDFAARTGTSVLAAADGIVTHRGRLGRYGKTIEVYHGGDISTLYGHLSDYRVVLGDFVERGELIGLVGSTGRSTGPHLHYEVRRADRPRPYTRLLKEIQEERPGIGIYPDPTEK
ncbi:MAG: M23 family metallopeptidase [Betaproteobacteria bacterium AqS2]|uniref:M23 family metallopeptidase n=1 Tax=Candidatus Amphirhobacter heronislandensis TaxID=1732024 RepID=A0A930XXC3_9GAMM|nr:M23 family metallopeptidase [Betaproteobacteria bacterium AqS2]